LALIAVSFACYWRADRTPYARYLAEALEVIDQNYVEPVDDQKLFDGAMEGMVGRLDDYSGFVSHEEATRFQQSLDQKFGGIGIEVALDPKTEQLTVTTPVPNTPAYREGIQAGDKIVAINGESVENFPPKERLKTAIDLLRGKEGEPVTLQVSRPGEPHPIDYRLVRAIIHVDSVLGDARQPDNSWNFMLARHEPIGYLRVASFGEQTVAEFTAAMQWLTEHGCQGLIIDLRNDPGGLLTSARDICDMFIQAGQVIVTTKDRDRRTREEYRGSGRGLYQHLPLVVLVNRGSASASEIVAACLQDQGRAKVVGQRSWGKGTVQHVIPVEGGQSVLRLTTASYWRPNGRNIHRFRQSKDEDPWGVSPDEGCLVAMDDKQFTAWLEERRRRDVVYSPGKSPAERTVGDATDFDPVLKRAVELLEKPAASDAAHQRRAPAH
jgi:carboxyl-terminal processing protease